MIYPDTRPPLVIIGKYSIHPCFCRLQTCDEAWAELTLPEDELARSFLSSDYFPYRPLVDVLQRVINLRSNTIETFSPTLNLWRPERHFHLIDLLAQEAGGMDNLLRELRELRSQVLTARAAK